MSGAPPLCHTCGRPAGSPPALNRLPSGERCPTCCERALENLPALLPGFPAAASAERGAGRGRARARAGAEGDEVDEGAEERPAVHGGGQGRAEPRGGRLRIVRPTDGQGPTPA